MRLSLRSGWRRDGPALGTLPALALLAASAPGAAAQTQGAHADEPAQAVSVEDAIGTAAAQRMARAALLNLRAIPSPTQGDYRIAALVLDLARELAPQETPLLRRSIEAWQAAGQSDRTLALTRELLRQDPQDERALLRVASASVSRLQSAERRLEALDRLAKAQQLPVAARSRLTLDAALLARERGDEAGFVDRLTRAAQLDSTNKDAAALAATYFLAQSEDPLGRVELLANLLLADPLDPSTHMRLGQELLAYGAYAGSKRFLRLVEHLVAAHNLTMTAEERETLWLSKRMATWGAQGAEAALAEIQEEERLTRDAIARARYQAQLQGEDPDQVAAEFAPDPAIELTRLIIASALERPDEAEKAMLRLRDLSARTLERIDELLAEEDADASPAQRENLLRTALVNRAQMAWFRLWSGLELEQAQADLAHLAQERAQSDASRADEADENAADEGAPVDPAAVGAADAFAYSQRALERNRGWLAAQRGQLKQAEELLEPLAQADPLARFGLARAADVAGDARAAILGYARIALDQPATLVGLYARTRVERLVGNRLRPTEQAASLNAYARALPPIIDEMTRDPAAFISLRVELPATNLDLLDPLLVRIVVGNTTSIPLAVDETGPIGTMFLLTPRINARTQRAFTDAQPEVARLARKLRLEPRQRFEQTVWVGSGQAAQLLDLLAAQPVSLRWSALQSFIISPSGELREGGLSQRGDTGLATRQSALGADAASVDAILTRLDEARGRQRVEAILLAISLIVEEQWGAEARLPQVERAALAVGLAERLPGWPVEAKLATAVVAPNARILEDAKPIDDALRADASRLVRAVVLLSRIDGPDDPLLEETIARGADPLPELAALVRLRLQGWEARDEEADDAAEDAQGAAAGPLQSSAGTISRRRVRGRGPAANRPLPVGENGEHSEPGEGFFHPSPGVRYAKPDTAPLSPTPSPRGRGGRESPDTLEPAQ